MLACLGEVNTEEVEVEWDLDAAAKCAAFAGVRECFVCLHDVAVVSCLVVIVRCMIWSSMAICCYLYKIEPVLAK